MTISNTHVLCFWLNENKYSVIKTSAVDTGKSKSIQLDEIYRIFFEDKYYDGQIKLISDHTKCTQLMKELVPSRTQKTTTPAKTAKHPSTTPAKHSSTTPNKLSSTTPAKSVQRSILNKATPAKIGAQLTQVSDYANGLVSKKKPKPAHNDTLSLSSSSESENDDGLTVSDKPAKPKANEAFSSSLADIELNILRKKYDELNELNEQQKKEILKLKEEKAVLVTRNDALSSTYTQEDKCRMVQFALSTMKAFATPNDIIEISTFNKESDSLHGLIVLETSFPQVLIEPVKRQDLLDMINSKMKGSLVFKAAMSIFIPDVNDWEHTTAEQLLNEMPDIISSITYFIQKHQSGGEIFLKDNVRAALTQKVSDSRKKIRKLKAAALGILVETDGDSSSNGSETIPHMPRSSPCSNLNRATHSEPSGSDDENFENPADEDGAGGTTSDTCEEDEDPASTQVINKSLSKKNKLKSDGALSSLLKMKKRK